MKTGVYILKREGSVLYVGATTNYPGRLLAHKWMQYDCVEFIPCGKGSLKKLEIKKIKELMPADNRRHNTPHFKRLNYDWMVSNWEQIEMALRKDDYRIAEKARKELGYSMRTGLNDIMQSINSRFKRMKKGYPRVLIDRIQPLGMTLNVPKASAV